MYVDHCLDFLQSKAWYSVHDNATILLNSKENNDIQWYIQLIENLLQGYYEVKLYEPDVWPNKHFEAVMMSSLSSQYAVMLVGAYNWKDKSSPIENKMFFWS